ncbi:MAG: GTP-binding protein [Anaerolineaceae bacterium]|nr:GTP-binding protein [Anaerolineaceae bacterium]
MNLVQDTIVAVSSPLGSSPRAIVRLSGPQALEIVLRLFRPDLPIAPEESYCSRGGTISLECAPLRAELRATLFLMRGPRSYTRQDVVELHFPGNPALSEEVLSLACRQGARAADPGEFTARAFVSGRLDLAQAEAVMAVVNAGGERSLAAAQRLLAGRLSGRVNSLVDRLRRLLARVELAIDFSDQPVPIITAAEAAEAAGALRDDVVRLSRRSRDLAHLDGDLRVALVGRPNVGKSSLFNRLAGADRAMVTAVAGTTRDELRETFTIGDSRFVLSDTAGLADAVADIDLAGRGAEQLHEAARRRTMMALAQAELVLVVVEAGRLVAEAEVRQDVGRLLATLAAPAILVANKCDLPTADSDEPTAEVARRVAREVAHDVRVVAVSALTGQGLDALRAAIAETLHLGLLDRGSEGPVVAARHRRRLETSADALERAAELCAVEGGGDAFGEELLALELREAIDSLARITGRGSPEDVLNEIFAGFCIGK